MLVVNQRSGFGVGRRGGLEFVGSNSATGSGTTVSVSLTALTGGIASAAAAKDLVLVTYGHSRPTNENMTMNTSGYTELVDLYENATNDSNMAVYQKIMGGTPDTTAVANNPGSAAAVIVVHVWRGAHQTTPIDVTTTTAQVGNSAIINPPAITPVTAGAVIVCCGYCISINFGVITTNGLDNFLEDDLSRRCAAMSSYSDWESGSYDPAAFGLSVSDSTANSAIAATVALRPA